MTRYIKQRDNFRCGPVAVINSLRWAGADISTNYVYELTDKCLATPTNGGTPHYAFDRILREDGKGLLNVDLILKPRMYEIEDHLKKGGVAVLNYVWFDERDGDSHRHYVLITEESKSGRTFEVVNDFKTRPAATKIRRKTFAKYFDFRNDETAKAWLLTKV
jgi:hypothetical protein